VTRPSFFRRRCARRSPVPKPSVVLARRRGAADGPAARATPLVSLADPSATHAVRSGCG
jgi:hypothetical protein